MYCTRWQCETTGDLPETRTCDESLVLVLAALDLASDIMRSQLWAASKHEQPKRKHFASVAFLTIRTHSIACA